MATIVTAALAVPVVAFVLPPPRMQEQGIADQSAPGAAGQPKFEVTSVKSDKSGNAKIWMANLPKPGGHFTATNFTLRGLIGLAYNLFPGQARKTLLGTPDWMDSQRFDIEAETDTSPTIDQKRLLLQSLLADRFELIVHHETRQLPMYALVLSRAGKTGPQLKPHSDDAECIDPAGPPPPHPGPGAATPSFCGGFFMSGQSGRLRESGNKVTMAMLAAALSDFVDRPVVDKTGLAGAFDVTYEAAFAMHGGQVDATNATDPSGPVSIFTALQEQLGLKLESRTGPVDVLVIHHVAEPSPN